jgi:hypothetical protein
LWRVSSTHHRHWRRVGSRAATRKNLETVGSSSTSSLLPFLADGDDHRYLQQKKKTQQQVLVPFPSRFLDLLLHTDLFFFSFGFTFFSISGGRF